MSEPRYRVLSEHVRGERRYYSVWDSLTDHLIAGSYDKRTAERICECRNQLNRQGGKGMICMPAKEGMEQR
jgi:hypothetical protein